MRGLSRAGDASAIWHVMNRGVQRLPLFTGEGEQDQFIRLLQTFTVKADLKVLAYCVMSNHYHALVHGSGEQLIRCFHEVDRLWALTVNERRETTGHAFQGPFLSFRQRSQGWAVRTSAYIHLNPVPRMCRHPAEYPWSSYQVYLGTRREDWVDTAEVLTFCGMPTAAGRVAYKRFVEMRMELCSLGGAQTEEENVFEAAARELALSMSALQTALGVTQTEARHLAAYYGREELSLPMKSLARALGYKTADGLSVDLSRLRRRLEREAAYKDALARAVDLLRNQTL